MSSTFASKYEQLRRQISEANTLSTSSNVNPFEININKTQMYSRITGDAGDNENYKIFSSTLERRKTENPRVHQLFKAKFNLLTGKNLENVDFKLLSKRKFTKQISPPIENLSYRIKKTNELRDLRKMMSKKQEINFGKNIFPSGMNDYNNNRRIMNTISASSNERKNRNYEGMLKRSFPEYNGNGNCMSFITNKAKFDIMKRNLNNNNKYTFK